ncbi:MAG: TetR/AcrR family transcriptional regulator [Desulfobacterales bacterium]|jgi:AcrR family transcriptional regulator|nr:TetR/AcrR family transcriptional regulator [Desulfobacterales bacterium]
MPAKNASNQEPLSKSAQRRQREREFRYQTILKAAETLFANEGYNMASMEQIADAAEVSVGAVYFYFKNKEDLLIQLLGEIGYLMRNILGRAFKKHGADMEAFKQAGYAFFEDFCVNYPEKCAIIFRESVGKSPEVEKHRKELFDKCTNDVLSALMTVCNNQGYKFKGKFSAEVIAVSIMGIYERVAYHYILWQNRGENLKNIGRDALAFILGGISNLFEGA